MLCTSVVMYVHIIPDYANGEVDGQLRLVDGGGTNDGRIEISLDGYWGTVCSENFDKSAADVACKELGFNESINITQKLVLHS